MTKKIKNSFSMGFYDKAFSLISNRKGFELTKMKYLIFREMARASFKIARPIKRIIFSVTQYFMSSIQEDAISLYYCIRLLYSLLIVSQCIVLIVSRNT